MSSAHHPLLAVECGCSVGSQRTQGFLFPQFLELARGFISVHSQVLPAGNPNRFGDLIRRNGRTPCVTRRPHSRPSCPQMTSAAPAIPRFAPNVFRTAPNSGTLAPNAAHSVPTSGQCAPTAAKAAPNSGRRAPISDDHAPSADSDAPIAAHRAPNAADSAPIAAHRAPGAFPPAPNSGTRAPNAFATVATTKAVGFEHVAAEDAKTTFPRTIPARPIADSRKTPEFCHRAGRTVESGGPVANGQLTTKKEQTNEH